MEHKHCQCYLERQNRWCKNPVAKGESLYCSTHRKPESRRNCKSIIPKSPQKQITGFQDLSSYNIRDICQTLYDQKDYKSLYNFILSNKRAYESCKDILEKAKIIAPRKISQFVKTVKDRPRFDGRLINTDTTPQQLGKMIESVKGYQDTDEIISSINTGYTLINYLVHLNRFDLIKYLVNSRGKQLLEIGDSTGAPPFIIAIDESGNPTLASQLLDLGTPLGLLYPIISQREDIREVDLSKVTWQSIIR